MTAVKAYASVSVFDWREFIAVLKTLDGREASPYVPCRLRMSESGGWQLDREIDLAVKWPGSGCRVHFMDGDFVSHLVVDVLANVVEGSTVTFK